jgi:hypothetical protein
MGCTRPWGAVFALFLLVAALPCLVAQEKTGQNAAGNADPALLIGLKLEDLLSRFGVPQSVYAVRGREEWQDDVVFVYGEGDFYVYGDRVWQIGLKSHRGVSLGDSKPAAALVLGNEAEDRGDQFLLALSGRSWPLMFRINFSSAGRVTALYIYRPDF